MLGLLHVSLRTVSPVRCLVAVFEMGSRTAAQLSAERGGYILQLQQPAAATVGGIAALTLPLTTAARPPPAVLWAASSCCCMEACTVTTLTSRCLHCCCYDVALSSLLLLGQLSSLLLSGRCRLDLKKCHKELQTLEKAMPLDGK